MCHLKQCYTFSEKYDNKLDDDKGTTRILTNSEKEALILEANLITSITNTMINKVLLIALGFLIVKIFEELFVSTKLILFIFLT